MSKQDGGTACLKAIGMTPIVAVRLKRSYPNEGLQSGHSLTGYETVIRVQLCESFAENISWL
jgi:hypothetical protein